MNGLERNGGWKEKRARKERGLEGWKREKGAGKGTMLERIVGWKGG